MRPFTLDQLSQNLLILGPWGSAFKNKQVNRQTLSWTFLVCYQNSTPLVEEILRSCMRVLKFTAKYLVGKFEANFAGGGHGKPLQYSCLENLMDRGAW